jgi:hypothetical protein
VTFFLEQNGDLTIKHVACVNEEVRKYVKEHLSGLNCRGIDCPVNTHYRITVNFRKT